MSAIDITGHTINQHINVVRCKKPENRLRFELNMPSPIPTFRYFNDPGYYRLTVGVAATDMATQKIVLEVDNTGDWDDFAVTWAK